MPIDLRKLAAQKKTQKPIDPLEIWNGLDRAVGKEYLRPIQEQVLSQWFQQRTRPDTIIKMNTGTGKTLVGLMMLQSSLNEGLGPALYLCPDKYLVKQVLDQAKQFGVHCVAFSDTSPGIPSEFSNSEAILVTNVKKFFNGRSVFGVKGGPRPPADEEFQPNVMVRNWQSIPLEAKRDDWIGEEVVEEGRFIPAAVLRAMRRRAQQDPNAVIQRMLKNWRDVFLINDEAHHAYGEKKSRKGEEPEFLRWSKILDRIAKATRVSLVADLSATPWYGSGSAKPEGSLYEWLVSDFSVYDAFESGLVKVVRLPDPDEQGRIYLDLWDLVKGAKTKEEYLRACKGAIASIYASWSRDYQEWSQTFDFLRTTPCPVLLCVADNATRAAWLFEHLTKEYEFLRNPNDEDHKKWHTIQIDTGVFDANKGSEAALRNSKEDEYRTIPGFP